MYENRRIKSFEIILRRREWRRGGKIEVVNLIYIISSSVHVIMYPPVQILYANKNLN
jgi:hypothetical protein